MADTAVIPDHGRATYGKCSKCGENERHSENDGWCRPCRAEYQKVYTATSLERKERKGFALGIQAMRDCMAEQFNLQGSSSFNGYEIEYLIRQAPGPKLPE